VEIQLARLRERLADRRITLDVTDDAMALLAREGFDPAFGARPLKRVIQRQIGDRAAVLILEGKAGEGATLRVGTTTDGAGEPGPLDAHEERLDVTVAA
jgi:ATP-dependent Clp protease ATP-binding subunit ClpB